MKIDENEKRAQRAELMNLLGQLRDFDCIDQRKIIEDLDELWLIYSKEHNDEMRRLKRLEQKKREN